MKNAVNYGHEIDSSKQKNLKFALVYQKTINIKSTEFFSLSLFLI